MKARFYVIMMACVVSLVMFSGCASPKGETAFDKQGHVQDMRSEALEILYSKEPALKGEVANAPGYAVLDLVQTQFLITSFGNGYGVVRDNLSGRDTYMSAFGLGAGLGVGVKGYRALIIFEDREVMHKFVEDGWAFSASGTADAKVDDTGGSVSGAAAFTSGLKVRVFTSTGLMLGGSLRGGKVWKDDDLNI